MTSAQKYNKKLHEIFENAKELKAKNAPKHAIQLLEELTNKVDELNTIQHRGCKIQKSDWCDLYCPATPCKGVSTGVY